MLDPSVQAILEGPSVTYAPASASKAGVGLQVVPFPAGTLLMRSLQRSRALHVVIGIFTAFSAQSSLSMDIKQKRYPGAVESTRGQDKASAEVMHRPVEQLACLRSRNNRHR